MAVEEQLRMLREDIAVGLNDILGALRTLRPLPAESLNPVTSQHTCTASNTSTATSLTSANAITTAGIISRLPVTDLPSLDELEKSLQQREQFDALVSDAYVLAQYSFGGRNIISLAKMTYFVVLITMCGEVFQQPIFLISGNAVNCQAAYSQCC